MGLFSTALLYGMTIRESATDGSDFTNPAADYRRLFLGEDGLLHVKDSAGTVTDPFTAALPAWNGAKVTQAANQSVNTATWTAIGFSDADTFDTGTYHDPASNNTKVIASATKKAKVTFRALARAGTTGIRYVDIYKNGSSVGAIVGFNGNASDGCGAQTSATIAVANTDYIEGYVYHSQGSALNWYSCEMTVEFVTA